jgi:hypothetical protein
MCTAASSLLDRQVLAEIAREGFEVEADVRLQVLGSEVVHVDAKVVEDVRGIVLERVVGTEVAIGGIPAMQARGPAFVGFLTCTSKSLQVMPKTSSY